MSAPEDIQGVLDDRRRDFGQFLQSTDYEGRLTAMVEANQTRLIVDIDVLRKYNAVMADELIARPTQYIRPYEEAIREFASTLNKQYTEDLDRVFYLGLDGALARHHVSPRHLSADLLGTIVKVEGIVTKCSLVRPKIRRSVHYCPETQEFVSRVYRDATDLSGLMPTSSAYPTKDQAGNPLETEYGLSVYDDFQSITMQEMPERAPPGQLPRSVEVFLSADLVDAAKPGDRLQVVGVYRALAGQAAQGTNGVFRTVVLANNVIQLQKEAQGMVLTSDDIRNIKSMSRKKPFETLSRSLAHSIYGHEEIKKAILLQLVGGLEKNLESGTHIRGDINILMVGDPSTAKSQLLRFVLRIAPLSISTTGKGSSGVGLTAAVTTDMETGDRHLEAGAMVLADRGIVCIDEFDKMGDADRTAIHEVMEQQTVTIAKAGIHTTLNARCSVLAAANPVYGSYNVDKKPMENVGLPDSLLSRFDLLFIVLDSATPEQDHAIATHVLLRHCMSRSESSVLSMNPSDVFESTSTKAAEGIYVSGPGGKGSGEKILSMSFIKKYILYARSQSPKLSAEASAKIVSAYVALRETTKETRTVPITVRALETMVRLATAHAKLHLREFVDGDDADVAVALLEAAISGAKAATRKRKRGDEEGANSSGGDDDDDDDGGDADTSEAPRPPRSKRSRGTSEISVVVDSSDPYAFSDVNSQSIGRPSSSQRLTRTRGTRELGDAPASEEPTSTSALSSRVPLAVSSSPPRPSQASDEVTDGPMVIDIPEERVRDFRKRMVRLLKHEPTSSVTVVMEFVNNNNNAPFSEYEIDLMLKQLASEDKIMYHKGVIYLS